MTDPATRGERRVVWIAGAGSGIGRAAALDAAAAGWNVALSGRRADALEATAEAVRDGGGEALVLPVDVRESAPIVDAVAAIAQRWGRLDGLVIAAGVNSPKRQWADQEMSTFTDIVQTNLVAAAEIVAAALPQLRIRGGVIVMVSSYSAWTYHPMAGVAYSASKSGLASLIRTLNSQEAANGIRACHLCPGDVDTDFLTLRPRLPEPAARKRMLSPGDVARSIQFVLDAPPHLRFDEIVLSPVSQV